MRDVVEAMARAMFDYEHVSGPDAKPWDAPTYENVQGWYESAACAALRAALVGLREPSASMAEAGDRVLVDTYCYSYRDDMPAVFRAMLDAALAELDGEAGK